MNSSSLLVIGVIHTQLLYLGSIFKVKPKLELDRFFIKSDDYKFKYRLEFENQSEKRTNQIPTNLIQTQLGVLFLFLSSSFCCLAHGQTCKIKLELCVAVFIKYPVRAGVLHL